MYLADIFLVVYVRGLDAFVAKRWNLTYLGLAVVFLVDIGANIVAPERGRSFTRPFRSVFLVCKVPTLRRLVAAMLRAARKVGEVLALAFVLVAFYAVIGVAMFSEYYWDLRKAQYRDSFSTFGRSALSLTVWRDYRLPFLLLFLFTFFVLLTSAPRPHPLQVLLTTENFPQIFIPACRAAPVAATLYFFSFFIMGVWILFNLILVRSCAVRDRF